MSMIHNEAVWARWRWIVVGGGWWDPLIPSIPFRICTMIRPSDPTSVPSGKMWASSYAYDGWIKRLCSQVYTAVHGRKTLKLIKQSVLSALQFSPPR